MYRRKLVVVSLITALILLISAGISIQAAEVWHYWLSGGEKEALEALVEAAQELYPEGSFSERGIPGAGKELRRQLGAALLAGDPPEAFQTVPGYSLKSYVDAGQVYAIDEVWDEINGDEIFNEGLRSLVKFNGHAYAIPLNTHIISHIFYNKAIFDKYALEPPITWEEFRHVTSVLRDNGIEPLACDAGHRTCYHLYTALVDTLGPEGYLALGAGEIPFTDPRVREAFELYGDAFVKSYMFGWSGYGWAEAANEVISGNAGMYQSGDWIVAYFEQAGWEPDVDFDFFPAPGTEDVMVMQIDALAAPKGSKDPEGAMQLLTAAGRVEGQAAFNKYKGSLAANLEVDPGIYNEILYETYERMQRVSVEGHMLPNQSFLMPPAMWEEFARQVEIYALEPTEKTLDSVLNTLESQRKELLEEGVLGS